MDLNPYVLMVILGTALVASVQRVVPLVLLSRIDMPAWLLRWLDYVPISVMAALMTQEVLMKDGRLAIVGNLELIAAIPTLIVAIWTRSILGTVVAGMVSVMLLRML